MNAKEAAKIAQAIIDRETEERLGRAREAQARYSAACQQHGRRIYERLKAAIPEAARKGERYVDMKMSGNQESLDAASYASGFFDRDGEGFKADYSRYSYEMGDNEYPCTVHEVSITVRW